MDNEVRVLSVISESSLVHDYDTYKTFRYNL